jgi:putative hydrolase of the HAD superfamily
MSDPSDPRAVFFDLGGTLFSYGELRGHIDGLLKRLLSNHGIEASEEQMRQAYREAMARQFAVFSGRPYYLHRDLFEAAHRDFLARFDAEPAPGDSVGLLYLGQVEVGLDAVQPRPRAAETLAALRERGLHLAIVSNIDDDQFHPLWQSMGLGGLFDATTTSEEARSCKPDRGIFDLALDKARGVRPENVFFVGDSPVHDIAGARALGMKTVLITDAAQDPGYEPRADHVIRSLPELLAIVDA